MVLGISQMNLLSILLPALVLHGSFDYFLFAMGFVQYAWRIESVAFGVFTFVFPFVIAAGGAFWAYRSFKEVESRHQQNWRPVTSEDDQVTNNML